MGWSIGLIDNTVEITEKCAKELLKKCGNERYWDSVDEVVDSDGYLVFNSDHYEHMDYVDDPDIQAILEKHKVNGIITFGSLDGDDAGSFWGYQFDDGKLTYLVGEVVYKPVE